MKHSRSTLFLMELIIALLFFALASTVCIRLFSKAYLLREQTNNENHALIYAQNLAECFLATQGDITELKTLFPNADSTRPANTILLWLNHEWKECISQDACFSASLVIFPEQNGLITANITITSYEKGNDTLYSLSVSHHVPERRGSLETSLR